MRFYRSDVVTLALVAFAGFMTTASAEGMDYSAIAGAVDWQQMLLALGVIALAIAGILVAKRGAKMLLSFIGR